MYPAPIRTSKRPRELFDSLVKIPLESDIAGDLLRYFHMRKAWDEKQYAAVTDADLIFRNHAQGAIHRRKIRRVLSRMEKRPRQRKRHSAGAWNESTRHAQSHFDTFCCDDCTCRRDSANTGEEGKNYALHL